MTKQLNLNLIDDDKESLLLSNQAIMVEAMITIKQRGTQQSLKLFCMLGEKQGEPASSRPCNDQSSWPL